MKYLFILIILTLYGCGNSSDSNLLEYKVMYCDKKTDKCSHFETYKFKVRQYNNTVYVNIYDEDGTASGNSFLPDCQVFDKKNWKCKYTSMVNGEIVESFDLTISSSKLGFYSKYERVQK